MFTGHKRTKGCIDTPFRFRDLFAEIFAEELFDFGKGDDVLPVVEVGVACAGYDHEQFVVLLAGDYGEFLVGVASEIE